MRKKKVSNYFNYLEEPKNRKMKDLFNTTSKEEELKQENEKLREKLALMKTQIDSKDRMFKANELMLNAKDSVINAKDSVTNAKDAEIELLRKRLKEYENITF